MRMLFPDCLGYYIAILAITDKNHTRLLYLQDSRIVTLLINNNQRILLCSARHHNRCVRRYRISHIQQTVIQIQVIACTLELFRERDCITLLNRILAPRLLKSEIGKQHYHHQQDEKEKHTAEQESQISIFSLSNTHFSNVLISLILREDSHFFKH